MSDNITQNAGEKAVFYTLIISP